MMLVDGAVSVRTASEVLGHATTSITADIYGHVAEQAKTHALEVVAGALRTTASDTAVTPLRSLWDCSKLPPKLPPGTPEALSPSRRQGL